MKKRYHLRLGYKLNHHNVLQGGAQGGLDDMLETGDRPTLSLWGSMTRQAVVGRGVGVVVFGG